MIQKIEVPREIPSIVSFKEDICQLPIVSGGKGSSLGKLTSLSKTLQNFVVPDGVVVTTVAYSKFMTKAILHEVNSLEEISHKKNSKPEEIKEVCERIKLCIMNSEFPTLLRSAIEDGLKEHFKEKIHTQKYAVRSSATGEDTEQMSAAGQMETYLGVSGMDEILIAVKKCWASQFSFIATEYKRRYGQCYNSSMAVVIQEMVPCDVAGVLFTCDPLTGNPTLMSITANYGLGESVVSGSEDPDMITLKRSENDEIQIKSIEIGQKSRKIVAGERETNIEDVPLDKRSVCSLSQEKILSLSSLAIQIEKHYRSHRDIEWGVFNGELYIFQSRPVTSYSKETEFEIDHEFDCPMRIEDDYYSVSNAGEICPTAFSPLGLDMTCKVIKNVLNSDKKVSIFQLRGKTNYFMKGWVMMLNHFLFNVADLFPLRENEELSTVKKASLISLFGRVPDDEEMYNVSRARYGKTPEAGSLYMILKILLTSGKYLKRTLESQPTITFQAEKYTTSKEIFDWISYASTEFIPAYECHLVCTEASSLLNMVIFSILGAAHKEFDDIVYKDFGNLLKTNEVVESADVPSATKDIASHIAKEINPEQFRKMSTEEALKWLQNSKSPAGDKFRAFIERHGHRCLFEFDLYSKAWSESPELLIRLLQNLTGYQAKNNLEIKSENLNDTLAELKVPLGRFIKMFIKFIVPYARRGVQGREASKSLLMKCHYQWKKAYWRLAEVMANEGRIPEKELLFFMTIDEIREILLTRSPKIVSKAFQRQKRHSHLNEHQFPEIMKGFPRPVDKSEADNVINAVNFSMKGIPVSQGVAKGFVRKALTLDEASKIKSGEILVTYSTDIGWTPYFPQLAGVVTELGGLISHGAVVSREYGIPCIAGLKGATKQFQTGDYVLLDGNKGILQKLQPPEDLPS